MKTKNEKMLEMQLDRALKDYDELEERIDKAIEYIEKNKKEIDKYQAKDTKLQVGTFMWNVDELIEILKGDSND